MKRVNGKWYAKCKGDWVACATIEECISIIEKEM
jgi:hypothetical protein